MTTHTPESGCYFDSHRGHYIHVEIIYLAELYGRKLDSKTRALVDRYSAFYYESDYPVELVYEESEAARQWLNDHITLDGHYWDWNDGDFGLYPLEQED